MACATCVRWMVWNESDSVQTFYYYDCNDGTTLLHSNVAPGAFYSVCGCQESGSYATSGDVYIENGGAGYINFEGVLLPACEILPEPSVTPSLFPTRTPNHTPTQTATPSITPSISVTPSTTPVICGSGVTTGTYYYTDCCGNFIQGTSNGLVVTMDYTKPSTGVVKLNSPATTTCLTPTPTQTPTYTPTNTNTPTQTQTVTPSPTLTRTPNQTPTTSAKVIPRNECDVFTIFDMGVQCYPIQIPSSSTSNDGILSVLVTGGTSPYSFYWTGGQRSQTLMGVPQGSYEITVVDYYGDYSATTICSLFLPSPTPTTTQTPTQTPTPSPVWPNLCFTYIGTGDVNYGPIQFTPSGDQNGRPSWTTSYNGTTFTIVWKPNNLRWEMQGWNLTSGIPVDTNNTTIPTGSWSIAGGQPAIVAVSQGTCPQYLPLQVQLETQNSSCSGIENCNGSIAVYTYYGLPPYTWSINNGVTYQTSNIFNGLCPGNYTVIAKDSDNNTLANNVTIATDNSQTTYTIGVKLSGTTFIGADTEISNWFVDVYPPLPSGVTISFDLNLSITKDYYSPGTGSISDTVIVTKNNAILIPTTTTTTPTQTNPSPNCAPYTYDESASVKTYSLTIGSGDIISGTSTSILTITNGVVGSNGCVTTLVQSIMGATSSPVITGGPCYSVINNSEPQGILNHTLSNTNLTSTVPLEVNVYKNGDVFGTQNCGKANGDVIKNSQTLYSFNTGLSNGTYTSGYTVNVGDVLVFDLAATALSPICVYNGLSCINTILTIKRNGVQVYTDSQCNGSSTFTYTVPPGTTSLTASYDIQTS